MSLLEKYTQVGEHCMCMLTWLQVADSKVWKLMALHLSTADQLPKQTFHFTFLFWNSK